ncbi:MAG: Gldg family protein [Verrucomicrobia bacterium]|nr:Gldg family protein [Verrucomicrobiota bacterium]
MKKKQVETLLYSVAGVGIMLVVVVAFNYVASAFKQRIDLTHDKVYTLSPGTKAILNRLDGPVEVRLYVTQGAKEMPENLKTYAQRVEDLLSEFQQNGKGKIEIKKLNPEPDSDAEDSARLDGVEGQMLPTGESVYLGLAVSYLDQKVAIPFFAPEREKLMEYDIARAISRVITTEKPVVGVMASLPVFGQPMNPMMMRMGQQGQQPWVFISELQSDFDIKQVSMDGEKIPDEVKLLVVVHPKSISDKAQYAIDQFIMRGGKLIAFLDAMSLVDRPANPSNPMMANMPGGPSSLDKLLKAWGIQFDTSKVVADMNYARELSMQRGGAPQLMPAFLFMNSQGINADDVVTSQIDNLLLPFAGTFSGTPMAGLTETVLLKTTTQSQLVDGMTASFSGETIAKEFKPSGTAYPLAIRLKGKFKTAFPDGPPKDEEKKDDKTEAEKKPETKPADTLKETKSENVVVLVGDTDLLYDQFSVQVQDILGQRIVIPRNGNLNFVQNLVEQMTGDSNLIGVRSRAAINRPFTVVAEMQASAQEAYQSKLKEIEAKLADTQKRLNELQSKKEGGQRFILSPEQQQELEKFKHEEANTKKELKEVRKNLRRDIDSLEFWTKVLNIGAMPAVVILAGLTSAFFKRQRAKAK